MKHFFTMAACVLFSSTLFSQIWDKFYPTEPLRLWKVVELNDGQLVCAGTTQPANTSVNTVLVKTKRNGEFVKSVNTGQGFVYDLQFAGALFGVSGRRIVCYDTDLRQIWAITASSEFINRIRLLSNGNLVTLSASPLNNITMHIIKPLNGSIVLQKPLINTDTFLVGRLPEFTVIKDNLYAIVNEDIWKIDGKTGRLLSKLPFSAENLYEITTAADQTLLISKGEGFIYKVDTLGRQIWRQEIKHKSWTNSSNKDILIVNEINPGRSSGEVTMLDKNGKMRWFKPLAEKTNEPPFQARSGIQTSDGNFVVVGNTFLEAGKIASRIIKLGNNEQLFLNRIVGTAYIDDNGNCQKDADDRPRANWIVTAKDKNGDAVWSLTDSLGQYGINCDTGVFDIKLAQPFIKGRIGQTCVSKSTRLVGYGKTDSVNLFQTFENCAFLYTDIAIGRLRPCTSSDVVVNYSNLGIISSENAYITVELDPKLEFFNATRPLSNQSGQFYQFNVGHLAPSQRGSFIINARVRCDNTVRLGQTICVKADIFPNTNCTNTSAWSGANLSISGVCEQDSVAFEIKNTGTVASQSRNALIIENETPQPFALLPLTAQMTLTKRFPANGHTWRLTVEQEPNHPLSLKPTAFIEGCRSNASQSVALGFSNNFAFDDNAPTVAVSCGIVSNSFDPNDKTGYPLGYGNKHNIDQNQDLIYKIRFQNTGNDTAFTVVIRDTIDTRYLDMETIEFGASSHPYKPMLYDKNILQFTFNPIFLPDSFRNEIASNGFVQFRIKQKKDVPIGTKIENSAGIYFDFNAPVITNLATHTIAKPIFNTVKTIDLNNQTVLIEVSPNPFETETTFNIKGNTPLSIGGIFDLYDIHSRLIIHDNFEKNRYTLKRQDLKSGMYIFKIQTKEGRWASGKIVVL